MGDKNKIINRLHEIEKMLDDTLPATTAKMGYVSRGRRFDKLLVTFGTPTTKEILKLVEIIHSSVKEDTGKLKEQLEWDRKELREGH